MVPKNICGQNMCVRRDGQDVMVENEDPKVQKPTGYEQLNFLQKIRFQPTEEWDF